jgi:hypothetical protein
MVRNSRNHPDDMDIFATEIFYILARGAVLSKVEGAPIRLRSEPALNAVEGVNSEVTEIFARKKHKGF